MENDVEILTPKNKVRSLGLKRSIQRNKVPKTPLSDVKVNYKSLQDDARTASSPSTPCLAQRIPRTKSSYTTNCLPHRLSLSRRVRDNYKKKKLEFAVSTHDSESTLLPDDTNSLPDAEEKTPVDLAHAVVSNERILNSYQKHREKVQELKSLINMWSQAFKKSLEELSLKIEPRLEFEDLIARLDIPTEMIEYT